MPSPDVAGACADEPNVQAVDRQCACAAAATKTHVTKSASQSGNVVVNGWLCHLYVTRVPPQQMGTVGLVIKPFLHILLPRKAVHRVSPEQAAGGTWRPETGPHLEAISVGL